MIIDFVMGVRKCGHPLLYKCFKICYTISAKMGQV
nr:MAG TPA: hypothetical protein [Caudoviricetes sp.]